jgi:hypothetical protein
MYLYRLQIKWEVKETVLTLYQGSWKLNFRYCDMLVTRHEVWNDKLIFQSIVWCQATIRACGQFFFILEIFQRQLRVCYFMAPSLTRGQVCNLLLLLAVASAVPLGLSPVKFYCPNFSDSPNMEGQVPVFISPRSRWPSYAPGHWVPFSLSPMTHRATVNVF